MCEASRATVEGSLFDNQTRHLQSVTPLLNPALFPLFPIKFCQHTEQLILWECYFHTQEKLENIRDVSTIYISKMSIT